MLLGSIEAGGTKFVCAVGNEDYRILQKIRFPTTDPQTTLKKTITFFQQFKDLEALSIASFGPVELKKNNSHFGYITDTPKTKWRQTDF